MFRASLNRDGLCAKPKKCRDATDVRCQKCGAEHTPADKEHPGACPSCSSPKYLRLPCAECPLGKLDEAMASPAGNLRARASKLDQMLQLPGMAITPRDIDMEEWHALEILWSERARAQKK